MKTKLTIGILAIASAVFLFGFSSPEDQQAKRTEEYGMIIWYSQGTIEKTANGKTEIIKLESEKLVGGFASKNTNSGLISELNKMNEDGYEIVSVSSDPSRDLYLFKRKL